jgi:PAS domain S-box-containing protein
MSLYFWSLKSVGFDQASLVTGTPCDAKLEACRQLGYQRGELLDMGVSDIDAKFSIEDWPEHWAKLKRERPLLFESRHRNKAGVVNPVEIKANFIEYEQKFYKLTLARDIGERKQVEDALRLARDAAEAANRPVASLSPRTGMITNCYLRS